MSKNKFLRILLPSIALTFGSQAYAYKVQEAVAHTVATSPDFLIQTNKRDEVDKELRESYAGYLPTLDMTAGAGEQYSNNPTTRAENPLLGGDPFAVQEGTETLFRTEFGLLASQMIFDGWAVYHDVEGHKARVRAESWRVNGTAQDVAVGAIQAFLEVILRRDLVKLNQNNLKTHESIYGQIQKRSEGGIGRKADLDQAIARVALARSNLIAEEGNLRDAETEFLRKIGIPTPTILEWPEHPEAFPDCENDAIEQGLKQHPILRASVEDVVVTREAYKGARSPFMPRFDLQLSMTRNHNVDGTFGDTDENSAMIRMKWNLFNGGKDLAKICETAYRMQEAIEVERRAHRQVAETVRLAWSTYATAKNQMASLIEHVNASERTTEAYHKQFDIGQRTLLDVLDAENELFGARTQLANAKNIEMLGMFKVLQATGCLTEYFGVMLPHQAWPKPEGAMDGAFRFFDKSTTLFDF